MNRTTCELLADPERARAMGEAGRRRVLDNFTHAHTSESLRTIMGLGALASTEGPVGVGSA